jgi:hypothetical protein
METTTYNEGDDERINALIAEPLEFPEWLASTADLEWDELTNHQKEFFENYRKVLEQEHKTLAVRPRDPRILAYKMLQMQEAQKRADEIEAKKVVHFMSYDAHGQFGGGVYCSCGMRKIHKRGKVLAAWADKHFEKYGHYWKRS